MCPIIKSTFNYLSDFDRLLEWLMPFSYCSVSFYLIALVNHSSVNLLKDFRRLEKSRRFPSQNAKLKLRFSKKLSWMKMLGSGVGFTCSLTYTCSCLQLLLLISIHYTVVVPWRRPRRYYNEQLNSEFVKQNTTTKEIFLTFLARLSISSKIKF